MEGAGIKTFDFFQRVLKTDVRRLYSGDISEAQFVDMLAELIPQQLRRAWNEGMRENGLDPEKDMQPEWERRIQNLVADEFRYVDGFAVDIVKTAKDGGDINALLSRAELWANRYNDTVDRARVATMNADDHVEWVLGDTDHCKTCLTLGGVVATAAQWDLLESQGIYPKSPDLACHGFNCGCQRLKTDKPLTRGKYLEFVKSASFGIDILPLVG
jgi:hypothetical protein